MDIRDEIITGSFTIGEDGRKEPTDWKEYALQLEKKVDYVNTTDSSKFWDGRIVLHDHIIIARGSDRIDYRNLPIEACKSFIGGLNFAIKLGALASEIINKESPFSL